MASGLKNQGVSPDSDRSSRSSGAWTDWNVSLVNYAIVALDYNLLIYWTCIIWCTSTSVLSNKSKL